MRECEHGGETKNNGNCTEPAPDDGLPVQCVGGWAKDKHHYLSRYIDATRAVRAKFLKSEGGRPAGGAAFVDLFAGPGRCRTRETGEIIPGSPLVALEHAGSPFTKAICCDLDEENVAALRSRTAAYGIRAVTFWGDCNDVIDSVVGVIPPYGLNIALLDLFAVNALRFETIEKLARFKRMDLIVHFPTMDLKRNLGRNQESMADFVGGNADQTQVTTPADVPKLIDTLRANLSKYGYTADQVRSMAVRNNRNNVLYHLVFVSKNLKGNNIWQSITKRDSKGQGSLF